MKKFLVLFVILLRISSDVKSQNLSDTLCFKVAEIQKMLIAAKQKKSLDTLIMVYRSDINILTGKVNLLEEKDRNHLAIEKAYEGQVTVLNREVRRWKRKTTWTAVGGLVLTGLTAFLILK